MDIVHVSDPKGRGLSGKLLNLGVGNPFEKGTGGEDGFQSLETFRPLPQVFKSCRARGVLNPIEVSPPAADL